MDKWAHIPTEQLEQIANGGGNDWSHLSDEALEKIAAKQPSSSVGQSLARGAKNVGAGLLEIPDLLATPFREGINLGAKALGSDYRMRPMSDALSHNVDALTGGYTASTTPQHATEEAITRGVASMIPGIGIGSMIAKGAGKGAQALGKFIKGSSELTPANIAGTAATTGLMQESLNEDPNNVLAAMGQGLLGGIGAHKAVNATNLISRAGRTAAKENIGRSLGQKLGVNAGAIEDFRAAGVNPTLPDVANNKILKMSSHGLSHFPGSSGIMEAAKDLQRKGVLQGLHQGEYGDILNKAEASAMTSKGAKNYHRAEGKKHQKLFSQMEKDIEALPSTNVVPKHTLDYLHNTVSKFKTPKMFEDFKKSPLGHELMELQQEAGANKGALPYEYLKTRLDAINDKVTTHGLIGKKSQGALKTLTKMIDKDIERDLGSKLKAHSPAAYHNWKEARNVYRQYASEDIPKLNELYKADKKGTTDTFINLMTNVKKGAEKAKIALRDLSPVERVDLTNAVHKNLGEVSDGKFSPLKWVRSFKKLDEGAKNVLLSPLSKERRHKIESIANVMDHLKGTLEEANTSKSGHYATLSGLTAAITTGLGSAIHGHFTPAVTIGSTLLASRLGAEALTNPKVIDFIYNGMRMKTIPQLERHLKHASRIKDLPKTFVREVQHFQHEYGEQEKQQRKYPKIEITQGTPE